MISTARFGCICAAWILAFPVLIRLAFGAEGHGTLIVVGAIAAGSLFVGPLWVASAMDNRTRGDLIARYVAMLLLLAICLAVISVVEILIIVRSSGNDWN